MSFPKGIDVRQSGGVVVVRVGIDDNSGNALGTGTAALRILEYQMDGSLRQLDFADNGLKTSGITAPTAALTSRSAPDGTTTGVWSYVLSVQNCANFTIGNVYIAVASHSALPGVSLRREWQYGGAEGDLILTPSGAVNANVALVAGQPATAPPSGGVTFPNVVGSSTYAGTDTTGTTALLGRLRQSITFDANGNVNSNPATTVNVGQWGGAPVQGMPNSGNVTVGGYASGMDPGTLVWAAPSRTLSAFAFTVNTAPVQLAAAQPSYAPVLANLAPAWYETPPIPPTAAQIAQAVLTDTTDTAVAGSLGSLIGHAPAWYTPPSNPVDYARNTVAPSWYVVSSTLPTPAAIATAVWTDTTAADFAVAGSSGSRLMASIPQSGDAFARIGTAGAGLTAVVLAGSQTFSTTGVVSGVTSGVTVAVNHDKSGYSVSSVLDKTGYTLAPTGLDAIQITPTAGPATIFPQMVVQLWRRFFGKVAVSASAITTYAADGSTVLSTQNVSDDGVTQTQGAAS